MIITLSNQENFRYNKAQVDISTRREETASTISMLNTAKFIEDNTMLFKLKETAYL